MIPRFLSKVSPEPNSGCWLWDASVHKSGYPHFWCDGTMLYAHRYSYEQHYGPVPEGMLVMHRCDVCICVNPEHLTIGSNADNRADCSRKRRTNLKGVDTTGRDSKINRTRTSSRSAIWCHEDSNQKVATWQFRLTKILGWPGRLCAIMSGRI